ncbi:gas vesicle protein GvpN [Metabacillus sp. KIGAM252]|uniref:Gas vesicle protein GvpN n=1 Tax=Metabacillus flavus TaxID=2823519 RepID=A0ABS5LHL3_9BACI|nr:gas vesicle protein GvpN [Metabacillus flavus]MBS2970246.1 gas vesicle protein GvpN [Metabacillus flavus]
MTVLKEAKQAGAKNQDTFYKEAFADIMDRSASYIKAGYPVHFTGPSGVGKTTLALNLAKKRKRPVMLMHGNHELSNADLIGSFTGYTSTKTVDNYIRSVYKRDENVTETWKNGRLLEAVQNGYTLVYDEFTRSKPSTNNLFLSILEEKVLPLYGTKHTEPFIKVHPEFMVIFTSNPDEYAGVYQTQEALLDRLITIPLNFIEPETEAGIIAKKTGVTAEEAKSISQYTASLRDLCRKKGKEGPSLRASIMIAQMSHDQKIEIDGKNEAFQQLCQDIVWYQMRKSLENESDAKIQQIILSECKKI